MQIRIFAVVVGMALALPCLVQSGSAVPAQKGLYKAASIDKFMAEIDTNHDRIITRQEWQAAKLPDSAFRAIEFHKEVITEEQLRNHPYPPEALSNGALTVAGMKAYAAMLHGFEEDAHAPKSVDKFVAEVDTNHDGKMTREEWQAAGLVAAIFDRMDSSKRGYLAKDDLLKLRVPRDMLLPDGSLTVESMKTYDALHHPGGDV